MINDGEVVLPENIDYFNCKHGDTTGIVRCVVGEKTSYFPWDNIVTSELDALFEAVQFLNSNK